MFLLSVNVPLLKTGVSIAHASECEFNNDNASAMANQARGDTLDAAADRMRHYRGPLDDLLDKPSFKGVEDG
jgi:hypothetical protein